MYFIDPTINSHHIELGIGLIAVREASRDDNSSVGFFWTQMISGRIGYRYQKPDGRLIFRIGFTPVLQRERLHLYYDSTAPFKVFNPWGGISIGYSF